MIRKVKKGWKVVGIRGRSFGTYSSYGKAVKRLGQVEYFKHLNKIK